MELLSFLPSDLHVEASIKRIGDEFMISYEVSGAENKISWPAPSHYPQRKDKLWEKTCFEFFLADKKSKCYLEFNFSPSGDWQCYRFFSYRSHPIRPRITAPIINQIDKMKLIVKLNYGSIITLFGNLDSLEYSLNACLLEGKKQSFWAKSHSKDESDFHDRCYWTDNFAILPK